MAKSGIDAKQLRGPDLEKLFARLLAVNNPDRALLPIPIPIPIPLLPIPIPKRR